MQEDRGSPESLLLLLLFLDLPVSDFEEPNPLADLGRSSSA